jgi:hypothetical protein
MQSSFGVKPNPVRVKEDSLKFADVAKRADIGGYGMSYHNNVVQVFTLEHLELIGGEIEWSDNRGDDYPFRASVVADGTRFFCICTKEEKEGWYY